MQIRTWEKAGQARKKALEALAHVAPNRLPELLKILKELQAVQRELSLTVFDSLTLDYNSHHDPSNGRFTSGGGYGTIDLPNGKKKERVYNPAEYKNLKVGSSGNKERSETGGFEGSGKTQAHIKKHMKEVGAKSEREYQRMAVEYMSKPLGKNMEELYLENGKRYRYNYQTNEFGVANPRGNVSTYYKPVDKEKYWEEQVMEFGERK